MIGNNRWWAKLYFVHHQVVCFTVCPPPGMVEATRMVGNQEVGKEVARRVEGAIKVNLLSAILIINILIINIIVITSIMMSSSSSILVRGLRTLVHACCFSFLRF